MVRKIILVFKTHFDIGFTDLSKNVVQQYATTMLDEVIRTCDATAHLGRRKYVWTMPAWPVKVITERCDAGRKRALDRLIANGQIVWHALPFTSHTDFCSAGELHEGLRFARQLSDAYGKPYPVSAKMTDVPGHGIHLPGVLAGAGVRFLHLGCNTFASPPDVPFLFWWQAKSGERVLTMYSPDGYGTGLCPPSDWPYPVWMALMQTNDNCGPQTADAIERMTAEIGARYPDAEVVCGTMDEFWEDLSACGLEDVPVVTEDLADTWIHGVGAYPVEVAQVRSNRERIRRLQALLVKRAFAAGERNDAGIAGGEAAGAMHDLAEDMQLLDRYFEATALFGEHTWGADVKTWMAPERVYRKAAFAAERQSERYRFMEESWREQREWAQRATALVEALESRHGCSPADLHGQAFSLFNPHAEAFSGWVPLAAEEPVRTEPPFGGLPVQAGGQPMPMIRMLGAWHGFAQRVPPFSEMAVWAGAMAATSGTVVPRLSIRETEDGTWAENHRYRLLYCDGTGDILELFDKTLGRPLLRRRPGASVFSYRYDRYGAEDMTEYLRAYAWRFTPWGVRDNGRDAYPECARKTFRPVFQGVAVDEDTLLFQYEGRESAERYGDARRMELAVTLPPVGEELFVEWRMHDKQETPYVESGSLMFPLAMGAPRYRIGKAGTEIDPSADIREGANHALYCVESHIAACDSLGGVCIIPCDNPLAAIGETGIYAYRRQWREPEQPVVHVNLFNNMWGTNFPQWIGGGTRSRFVLFGIPPEACNGVAERAAMLLQGIAVTAGTHGDARQASFVLPEHMQLVTARRETAGWTVVLRDLHGAAAQSVLRADGHVITPVDLAGREVGPASRNQCAFQTNPHGLHAFMVARPDAGG